MATDTEIAARTQAGFADGQAAAAKAAAKQDTGADVDHELKALKSCTQQLAALPPEAAARVLLYLARRFGRPATYGGPGEATRSQGPYEGE
jgi:hypothetical protein